MWQATVTECARYYEAWKTLLQSTSGITKCDSYYKVIVLFHNFKITFWNIRYISFCFSLKMIQLLWSSVISTGKKSLFLTSRKLNNDAVSYFTIVFSMDLPWNLKGSMTSVSWMQSPKEMSFKLKLFFVI